MPDTSLHGQQLKADTFAGSLPSSEVPQLIIGPKLSAGARQTLPQTTVDQKRPPNEEEFLSYLVRPIPKVTPPKISSILRPRQLWEGTVVECQNGSFVGQVSDRTNPANPHELVTFELDELSLEDRKLVQPGASFYWTVGVEESPAGQIQNIDRLNFRRLPSWSTSSVREAEHEAKQIARLLFSE